MLAKTGLSSYNIFVVLTSWNGAVGSATDS